MSWSKNYSVQVRGKQHTWEFTVSAKPEHAQDWEDDGLIVSEVVNTIPEWVVDLGLLKLWVAGQDFLLFRWKSLWSGK